MKLRQTAGARCKLSYSYWNFPHARPLMRQPEPWGGAEESSESFWSVVVRTVRWNAGISDLQISTSLCRFTLFHLSFSFRDKTCYSQRLAPRARVYVHVSGFSLCTEHTPKSNDACFRKPAVLSEKFKITKLLIEKFSPVSFYALGLMFTHCSQHVHRHSLLLSATVRDLDSRH